MQLPGWVSLQCTSGAEDQPERYGAGCLLIPRHLTPLIARLRLVLIRGSIPLVIPGLFLGLILYRGGGEITRGKNYIVKNYARTFCT